MNLKYVKDVGKHKLMIDTSSLVLYLEKNYSSEMLPILESLQKHSLSNVPKIINYKQKKLSTGIISYEQYIEGKSLRELIEDCVYITAENLELYTRSLLETLNKLHSLNILHKDIKPENIIINEDRIYLIDFDISRQYDERKDNDTNLLGTKGYASPEQFGFAQTTNKSDIYSLGITLKELVEISILDQSTYNKYIQLIEQMIQIDSSKRPDAKQLLEILENFNSTQTLSKKQEKKAKSFKLNKLGYKQFVPWVQTKKGFWYDFSANVFFLVMTEEFISDPTMVNYGLTPLIGLIAIYLAVVVTNKFILKFSIPNLAKFKTKDKATRSIIWFLIAIAVYLVYSMIFLFVYNTLGALFIG